MQIRILEHDSGIIEFIPEEKIDQYLLDRNMATL